MTQRVEFSLVDFEAYNEHRLHRSGKYLRGKCHIHGGKNPISGQYNPETGHYKCFKCGAWGYERSHNDHASAPGRPSSRQAERREIKPVSGDLQERLRQYQTALPGSPGEAYLRSRGISLELAQKYGVGYAKEKNGIERVIFPHTSPSGEIINLYGRAIDPGIKLKHRHLPGNKGVFNAPALSCGTVALCEGPFDALSLIAAGHENTCAIFGNAGLSDKWEWVRARALVFCFDNDQGGEKWEKLAVEAYNKGKKVYYLEAGVFGEHKDLNEVWTKTGVIDISGFPVVSPAPEEPEPQEDFPEPDEPSYYEIFSDEPEPCPSSPYLQALGIYIDSKQAEFDDLGTELEKMRGADLPDTPEFLQKHKRLIDLGAMLEGWKRELAAGRARYEFSSRETVGREGPKGPDALTWDPGTADLVTWFQEHRAELPTEPFKLDTVATVINPAGWYAALEIDIAAGPGYIRSRWGLLKSDLGKLKAIIDG